MKMILVLNAARKDPLGGQVFDCVFGETQSTDEGIKVSGPSLSIVLQPHEVFVPIFQNDGNDDIISAAAVECKTCLVLM